MSQSKVILVTGGNRGIGKEIVRQLAGKGHTVLLGSRNPEKGRIAAREITGEVHPVHLDLGDSASMHALERAIKEKWGRLDVLINNAGVMSGTEGPSQQPLSEVRNVFEANFFGIYKLNQIMLAMLRNSDDARIVNMSSQMGERANMSGDYTAYRLSKYLLNGYTQMLADDLGADKIRVNAMCPGWVKTDMGGPNAQRTVEQGADTAVWLATADDIPTGKYFRDRSEINW